MFECDRQLACQFAGRFLSVDAPESVNDDVRDVLGELANMIGGNMKSALADRTEPVDAIGHGWERLRAAGLRIQNSG